MTRQLLRSVSILAVLHLALGLGGCDTVVGSIQSDQNHALATTPVRATPRLQSGDKIKIVVYGEDKLSGDYEVDSTGAFAMPLVGSVQAAGLEARELEQALVQKLRDSQILRRPVVTVNIATVRPFYVLGEVEKPGGYTYQSGLNAMSAVALAGGYTYRASKSRILVQRSGEKGFTEFTLSPDVAIFPGDLISVPERYF